MDKNLMRAYAAELIGTFALVFIGAGAVCVNYMTTAPEMRPGLVGIALANGLILAVALSVTLHISGGYLNPAVTLMLWSFNRLDTARMAWYIGAQLLGAVLAGGCLYLLFDPELIKASHLGTPHVNLQAYGEKYPSWQVVMSGTGVELALTFFVVLAIFGTILDPRGQRFTGLMVGLALAAVTFTGFALTGAATNPARWFGTVFWEKIIQQSTLDAVSPFADMFVYVAGPILGALLGGILYYKVVLQADREQGALGTAPPAEAGGVGRPAPTAPQPQTTVKAKK
jgi:aquaporin Z